jgi:hypothetical protein
MNRNPEPYTFEIVGTLVSIAALIIAIVIIGA